MTEKKIQNFIPTTRSICIALILIVGSSSISAIAADKIPGDDSVYNWGPWDQMVSPAAGPNPGLGAIASAYTAPEFTSDVEFTTPVDNISPTPRELSCGPAVLCGFGSTQTTSLKWGSISQSIHESDLPQQVMLQIDPREDAQYLSDWDTRTTQPHLSSFDQVSGYQSFMSYAGGHFSDNTMPFAASPQEWTKEAPLPNGLWSLSGSNLADGSPTILGSDLRSSIIPATAGGGMGILPLLIPQADGHLSYIWSFANYTLTDNQFDQPGWDTGRYTLRIYQEFGLNNNILFNLFNRQETGLYFVHSQSIYEYHAFGTQDGANVEDHLLEEIIGTFIIGQPTTLEQLDSIVNSGQVSASFNGFALDQDGRATSPVAITVNYGENTWEGSWNGGIDSTATSGVNVMGFDAQGVINGNTIASTSLQALDGEVSGTINGAFFNPDASAIGGVSDITKSTSSYENVHNVSVFAAVKDFQSGR